MHSLNSLLTLLLVGISASFNACATESVDLAFNALYFQYEEFNQSGVSLDKEIGLLPGLSWGLVSERNALEHRLGLDLYAGTVDYDGQTQTGAPHVTDTDERVERWSYRLGWTPSGQPHQLYGKISWHQWGRDIQPANGVSGLFERYRWWTYELGLATTLLVTDKSDWLVSFGIFRTAHGKIMIDLADYGLGKPTLNLGSKSGLSTAIAYRIRLSEKERLSLSLQYQHWGFGRSEVKTFTEGLSTLGIVEPRSTSDYLSCALQYRVAL